MEALLAFVLVLLVTASLIDWLLTEEAVANLRLSSARAGERLATLVVSDTILDANAWFRQVFDAVYGKSFWSWRRFYRSSFFSVTIFLFALLIIGIENTAFGSESIHVVNWPAVFAVFVPLNLLADFLSLQETRWVMERASGKSLLGVSRWVGVDLALTTMIYMTLAVAIFSVRGILTGYIAPFDTGFILMLVTPGEGLPFFVSTFGTSILWLAFVSFAVGTTILKHNYRSIELLVSAVRGSPAPARAVAGLVTVPVIVVFVVVKLLLLGLGGAPDPQP